MNLVLWNIRGAGSDDFASHARIVIDNHHPSIFIVFETKAGEERATYVSKKLGFDNVKVISPQGRKGGIWVMWKSPIHLLEWIDPSDRYFHSLFKFAPNQPEILVTGVHAPTGTREKNELWQEIQNNSPPPQTKWLMAGDFNEVVNQAEKMGGRRVTNVQGQSFTEMMDKTGLIDLSYNGPDYTWNNCREGLGLIRERLDRALANANLLQAYPHTQGKGKEILVVPDEPARWSAPPIGWFKLNTDGSWKQGNIATGGGAIRKDNGAWVVGFTFKGKARKPVEAELLAVRQGLELARTYGITQLKLEVDAKALMLMLKYADSNLSHPLGAVLHEVGSYLKANEGIDIVHVSRDANMLADALARIGWDLDQDFVVHNAVPSSAMGAFNHDLRGLN